MYQYVLLFKINILKTRNTYSEKFARVHNTLNNPNRLIQDNALYSECLTSFKEKMFDELAC